MDRLGVDWTQSGAETAMCAASERGWILLLTARTTLRQSDLRRFKERTVLVSEDRLSVNLKRHSVFLPVRASHGVI